MVWWQRGDVGVRCRNWSFGKLWFGTNHLLMSHELDHMTKATA